MSYQLVTFCKFVNGGRYLLNRFLGKPNSYPFITMFEDFQPSIDYNDESLRIVNSYYLTKVK